VRRACSAWSPSPPSPSSDCLPSSCRRPTSCRVTPCGSCTLHVRPLRSRTCSFAMSAVASALYLWPRTRRAGWTASRASPPRSGLLFTGIVLVTGHALGQGQLGRVLDVGCPPHLDGAAVRPLHRLPRSASHAGCGRTYGPERSAVVGLVAIIDVRSCTGPSTGGRGSIRSRRSCICTRRSRASWRSACSSVRGGIVVIRRGC